MMMKQKAEDTGAGIVKAPIGEGTGSGVGFWTDLLIWVEVRMKQTAMKGEGTEAAGEMQKASEMMAGGEVRMVQYQYQGWKLENKFSSMFRMEIMFDSSLVTILQLHPLNF